MKKHTYTHNDKSGTTALRSLLHENPVTQNDGIWKTSLNAPRGIPETINREGFFKTLSFLLKQQG